MEREKAKCAYVSPLIEVHEAAPNNLLGISPQGDHQQALFGDDSSDHERAVIVGNSGTNSGAKAMILGQEFSFSDLWEE